MHKDWAHIFTTFSAVILRLCQRVMGDNKRLIDLIQIVYLSILYRRDDMFHRAHCIKKHYYSKK